MLVCGGEGECQGKLRWGRDPGINQKGGNSLIDQEQLLQRVDRDQSKHEGQSRSAGEGGSPSSEAGVVEGSQAC